MNEIVTIEGKECRVKPAPTFDLCLGCIAQFDPELCSRITIDCEDIVFVPIDKSNVHDEEVELARLKHNKVMYERLIANYTKQLNKVIEELEAYDSRKGRTEGLLAGTDASN